jgi:hypothetical protein
MPHRVLYAASGQYLAAARLDDTRAVVEHALYWAAVASVDEARFLTAILNSPELTKMAAPMQARGEHNPRHYDKLIWNLPIPLFDPDSSRHNELAELAAASEVIAAKTDVSGHRTFQAQRRVIRERLAAEGVSQTIDTLVVELLGT